MTTTRRQWLVSTGLFLLSAVPILAGALRVVELSGGAEITPGNARFVEDPVPVLVHIIGATVYSLLGAFQFVPGLRRRPWHRAAGLLLVPCGLAAALSGLWMTVFYPHPVGDGPLLIVIRLVFGSAMALSIVLGVVAIRRRDVVRHGAWMTRAYAIGLGAGTQAVIFLGYLPVMALVGEPGELTRALLMAAGWVLNLAVAEWIIRRRPVRTRTAVGRSTGPGLAARPPVH